MTETPTGLGLIHTPEDPRKKEKNSLLELTRRIVRREPLSDRKNPEHEYGPSQENRYRVLRKIHQGGLGEVLLISDDRMKAFRAAKIVQPTILQKYTWMEDALHREAQALASVEHPNVLRVLDIASIQYEGQKHLAIVTEYLPENLGWQSTGQTLRKQGIGKKGLAPKLVAEIMFDTTRALIALRKAGISHRDIKPDNIVHSAETKKAPSRTKVIDIGLATGVIPEQYDHFAFGTPVYFSPERARLEKGADTTERSEIFSLALTIYELITGNEFYSAKQLSTSDLLQAIGNTTQEYVTLRLANTKIDALGKNMRSVLAKALRPERTQRYQRFEDFYEDFQNALADGLKPLPPGIH